MKGVPFLSKMVYKRVGGWTMLQTPSPPKPPTPCIKFCSVLLLWAAVTTKNTIMSNSTGKIQMV